MLLALLAASACRDRTNGQSPETDSGRPSPESAQQRPYSVQLHVHGSFSEGVGSIDSHSHEATDVGADVIWWSDHDFRITSYGHESTFGFEGWQEDMPPPIAAARRRKASRGVKELVPFQVDAAAAGEASFVADEPREGRRSLELVARSDAPEFARYGYAIVADRGLLKRPLASGVTLELSVSPREVGPDARVVVDLTLSEHPPREGLPFQAYHLRYVLDEALSEPYRTGTTFVVPVPFRRDEWNDLVLPVTSDAVRGFPFIHGADNSLGNVAVGVEVRRGATARARFDGFRIRQERSGPVMFQRQRELIDVVGSAYPDVHQLQGVEVSWVGHHLNEFSIDTRLIDYDRILQELNDEAAGTERRERITHALVRDVHARGGLVSYNHMFGAMMAGSPARWTREEVLDALVAQRVFGADILEVGYRDRGGHPLEDHLWVWDQLAQRGLFLVGTGVSDSHGGPEQRWRTDGNNFVSWIYARSPDKGDLIEGLRAGRVFFGDLVLFDGTLDVTAARGARMGEIVVTKVPSEEVTVRIDGLTPGDDVRLVVSGREAARWTATSPAFVATHVAPLDPAAPTVVRVEVYAGDGRAKVFGNPITFVREEPPGERLGTRLVHDAI